MKDRIIVIGGGGHAKVVISVLKKLDQYDIVGYIDIENKDKIIGVPYLGNDNVLNDLFNSGIVNAALGIGQIKSTVLRKKIVNLATNIGFKFPSIISPDCVINESVDIGIGTIIMDGVIIQPGTKIGDFTILNTKSSIDHDCEIGNFVHIAPGVVISGGVKIGNDVLIGTGVSVINNIEIGGNSIISAGSSVLKTISRPGIYRGIPAKFIKDNQYD